MLIEREWLDFGHKFADRNGNGVHFEDVNERCPVFMQWLECVYQLLLQYPCEFEFNEAFLVSCDPVCELLCVKTNKAIFFLFLVYGSSDPNFCILEKKNNLFLTFLFSPM